MTPPTRALDAGTPRSSTEPPFPPGVGVSSGGAAAAASELSRELALVRLSARLLEDAEENLVRAAELKREIGELIDLLLV